MKILLLEDDIILSEIIEEALIDNSFDVMCAYDGLEAEVLAYEEQFDLFLFDVNVPNLKGFELLQKLRKDNIKTPAIFITSLHTSKDLEEGFQSGGDDYIRKPFEISELIIRINNLKRIYHIESEEKICVKDNIIFDMKNNSIIKDGQSFSLTKKESMVLKFLYENKNEPISVSELVSNLWGYDDVPSDSTIRTYIKNIRKYIGGDCISNIKGVGYRFNSI